MEFAKVLQARYTCRSFGSRPVEREKLNRVLAAAVSAPSAGNLQSFYVYVVTDVKRRAALARAACAQGHVLAAPASLIFCADPSRVKEQYGERGATLYAVQDATVACTYAMLAATELGLNTGWVGAMDDDAVAAVAGAAEGHQPVAILTLGYAAGAREVKGRMPVEELVHFVR